MLVFFLARSPSGQIGQMNQIHIHDVSVMPEGANTIEHLEVKAAIPHMHLTASTESWLMCMTSREWTMVGQ